MVQGTFMEMWQFISDSAILKSISAPIWILDYMLFNDLERVLKAITCQNTHTICSVLMNYCKRLPEGLFSSIYVWTAKWYFNYSGNGVGCLWFRIRIQNIIEECQCKHIQYTCMQSKCLHVKHTRNNVAL